MMAFKQVLLCLLLAACIIIAGTVAWYMPVWSADIGGVLAAQHRAALDQEALMHNAALLSLDIRLKVGATDVTPLARALHNVEKITADGAQLTGHIVDNQDLIDGAAAVLWQHIDNTVGHVDVATLQEQKQQADIAAQSIRSMQAIERLATDPNGLAGVSYALRQFIAGPLSYATSNVGEFAGTLNTAGMHIDRRWLAPYSGPHPVAHKFGVVGKDALQGLGIGATLWRDSK